MLVCFLVTAIVLPPFLLQCQEHPTEWWCKTNISWGGFFCFFVFCSRAGAFQDLYSLSYCCSTSFKFSEKVSQYGSDRAGSKEKDSCNIWPLRYTVRILTPPAPPEGAFIWKRPWWEASFCKSANYSHYPRTVRIQWFAHPWGDWRRMLKSFACIKQVNCAALELLFSSYSSANWDAEDWVNWTSGQLLLGCLVA